MAIIFTSGVSPIICLSGVQPDDQYWDDQFHYSGVYGTVYAIASSGSKVYVGGDFNAVDDGSISANNIVVWDDSEGIWEPLGEGTDGIVRAIAIGDSGEVYVGGRFLTAGGVPANNIAMYDPNTGLWSSLGDGVTGEYPVVNDLYYSEGLLYVAGEFGQAGSTSLNNAAVWDGSSWQTLGWSGGRLETIAAWGDDIYVGGRFIGPISYIGYRDQTYPTWSGLGDGLDGGVLDIDVLPWGTIVVVGEFQMAGPQLVKNVATWSGSWHASGGGTNKAVHAAAVFGTNDIYVGGEFEWAGGVEGRNLVAMLHYYPPDWEGLGEGIDALYDSVVYAADVTDDGSVFYGGRFEATGDCTAYNIVKWDGERFTSLASGSSNGIWSGHETRVYEIVGDHEVMVGGYFTKIGNIAAHDFAIFNSETNEWTAPDIEFQWRGEDTGSGVHSIAVNGSTVYLGGQFDRVILEDGSELYPPGLVKWDRTTDTWSSVNFIEDIEVEVIETLELYGGDLYIGGSFVEIFGEMFPGGIVRWDGTHAEHFGYGVGQGATVYDVEFIDGSMYIGGAFSYVYDPDGTAIQANGIAKWNGHGWETVGNLLDGQIYTIIQYDGKIIAGGAIYRAVDEPTIKLKNLVVLNGDRWATFEGGLPTGYVSDIEVTGSAMYVAGYFSQIGVIEANNIAKWDGSDWTPLGSGTNERVDTVHASQGVYVGGMFTTAGFKPSYYIGRWAIQNAPPIASAGGPYSEYEGGQVILDAGQSTDPDGDTLQFRWDFDNDGTWDTDFSNDPTASNTWYDDWTGSAVVEVTDGENVDTDAALVTILDLGPTAGFSWSPEPQGEGSPVQFTDESTSSPDVMMGWSWDFGSLGASTDQNPAFTFVDDGAYTVTLTVKDDDGSTDTVSHTATVDNVPPAIGPITAPLDPVAAGVPITASADFTDPGILDTHTAVWDWGDGATPGTVTESDGSGSVSDSHSYATPGVYTIVLTVTDDDGGSGVSMFQYIVIQHPDGGFVTGGGWIDSPLDAYASEPTLTSRATFGFVAKYKEGADTPTGETEFVLHEADLNFHSNTYEWLVITGPRAQLRGTGTVNGEEGYGFILTAIDTQIPGGSGADRFRIKIWEIGGEVVYDNQLSDADDANLTTELGGGSVVIHQK